MSIIQCPISECVNWKENNCGASVVQIKQENAECLTFEKKENRK
ncbi:DUF1540 domain-containing protein [Paenibacillus sp. 481]|nr:DUF1540 domain-containing protein [Paenibacillus sp. 481]